MSYIRPAPVNHEGFYLFHVVGRGDQLKSVSIHADKDRQTRTHLHVESDLRFDLIFRLSSSRAMEGEGKRGYCAAGALLPDESFLVVVLARGG